MVINQSIKPSFTNALLYKTKSQELVTTIIFKEKKSKDIAP